MTVRRDPASVVITGSVETLTQPSAHLPALTPNDVGERQAPTGSRWPPRHIVRSRIPEAEDVLAVLIGRIAERPAAQRLVVDRCRNGSDPSAPRHENHVLRRAPEVPDDGQRLSGRARIRRDERNSRGGA